MKWRGELLSATAISAAIGLVFLMDKGWSDYTQDRDNHRNMQETK